jgi:hypothetical protein
LQKGPTIKQLAKQVGVSERQVYMAKVVHRLRPDLADKCLAGEMRINAAYKIAMGKQATAKATSWESLMRAWEGATDDDRDRFVLMLLMEREGDAESG